MNRRTFIRQTAATSFAMSAPKIFGSDSADMQRPQRLAALHAAEPTTFNTIIGTQAIGGWELYDNEGTPDKPGGFWLINEKNEKQPVWQTHQRFYQWASQRVKEVTSNTGAAPASDAFRKDAANFLRGLQGKNLGFHE